MRGFLKRWWQSGGLRQYFLVYTIIFIIMVLCVFGVFFINGKSFIWGSNFSPGANSDGWSQHYNALVYYGRWLRSIIAGIFIDHTFEIPAFNFSLGYGSDVTTTLHYYVIGDPLTVFSVFVPTRFMAGFYNFLIILRLYLAGIAFSLFCFYALPRITSGAKSVMPSKTAVLAGTFIYVFCGFALYASIRHPYFMNPMIYFPLLLLGVEWILAKKKPVLFVVMAFICTVSNFYFLYMLVILTILYVVWRLCSLYSRGQLRVGLLMFGKIAGYAFLGVGLGAVMLVPVINLFLGDSRSSSGYTYDPLYSIGDYEQDFSSFLTLSSHDWTVMGYAAVALIAVFLLFIQKGNRNFKIAFIVLTVMTLLPVVGSIMNGFSYVSNRWIWGYSLLIGCIVVLKWRAIFELSVRERWYLVLCLVAYFLVCFVLVQSRTVATFFALAMAFISLVLIILSNERFGVHGAQIVLVACVLFNTVGNALFEYFPQDGDDEQDNNYVSEFVDSSKTLTGLEETEAPAIEKASANKKEFFRYSGSLITKNNTLYSGLHDTQYYWSLSNGNIASFRSELGLASEIVSYNFATLDSRTILSTLANVEYYVQDESLPYGYSLLDTYELGYGSEKEEHQLWVNDNFLPFGYTYDSCISRTAYDAMTPLEKQEALLQGCVIDDSNVQGDQTRILNSGTSISYKAKAGEGCSLEDNTITVTEPGAKLKLTFDGLEDAETYLYITGLNYAGLSPRDMYTDKEWDELSVYEKNQVNYREKYWNESTDVPLKINTKDTSGNNSSASFGYRTPRQEHYSGQSDFMVNLAYDEEAKVSMTLTFPTIGVYSFDSMEVLCQPMDNYEQQVEALAQDTLQNVDFHENRAHATNQVSGTISLDSAKYLLLTIPYSSGWSAYVDGEPQELLQADTAFMALYLEPGDHEINLVYHTPGSTAGLIISLLSLAVAIALIILSRLRRANGVDESYQSVQSKRINSQPTQPLRPVRTRPESTPQVTQKGTGQSVNSHQRVDGRSQTMNPRTSNNPHKRGRG